jgi:hypothetical protein
MTRLPKRKAEDEDAVGARVPPPPKLPRTGSGRPGRVINPASQSAGPSGPDEHSPGDSRIPTNSILSGTNDISVPSVGDRHPTSPAEAPMPPRRCRQAVNTASDETVDGRDVLVERTNPSRGPTIGGPEIWLSGSNFPTDLGPLYARFGDNFASAVGVLSPSFGKHLTASRPFKNLTCSRAFCPRLLVRVGLQ